jgi:hypothetical protein
VLCAVDVVLLGEEGCEGLGALGTVTAGPALVALALAEFAAEAAEGVAVVHEVAHVTAGNTVVNVV